MKRKSSPGTPPHTLRDQEIVQMRGTKDYRKKRRWRTLGEQDPPIKSTGLIWTQRD